MGKKNHKFKYIHEIFVLFSIHIQKSFTTFLCLFSHFCFECKTMIWDARQYKIGKERERKGRLSNTRSALQQNSFVLLDLYASFVQHSRWMFADYKREEKNIVMLQCAYICYCLFSFISFPNNVQKKNKIKKAFHLIINMVKICNVIISLNIHACTYSIPQSM